MREDCKHIESLGILTKEVKFNTVKDNIVPNTLVLETLMPYPGYYGEYLPTDTKPEDIFLINDKRYPSDSIFRTIKRVKKFLSASLDAAPCKIIIYNDQYYGIRLKKIGSYEIIKELQQWFIDENIKMMKFKNINADGLVNIKKLFLLERINHGIFQDMDEPLIYYLEIPSELSWSLFRKITFSIKNNIDNNNFDAARAFIYLDGITDFVRVYLMHADIERLHEIRNCYHNEIKKYI
ncbi:MAG: hypothetical protein JXB00_09765 [Bacteroidales bacterium]|nr:hypothetical protein [Bacteroidales bacterium]